MASQDNVIAGKVAISIDGVDIGITTADGVSLNRELETIELESAQSDSIHGERVTKRTYTASFVLQDLSLENWKLAEGSSEPIAVDGNKRTYIARWNDSCSGLPVKQFVITMPGANCSVRTLTGLCTIKTTGEQIFNRNQYSGLPIELKFIYNEEADELYRIVETSADTTKPTISAQHYVSSTNTEVSFSSGATNIPATIKGIILTFSTAIRPDQIGSSKFFVTSGGATIPTTVSYGVTSGAIDYTKIKLMFNSGVTLDESTLYLVVVTPGVVGNNGAKGDGGSVSFTTASS